MSSEILLVEDRDSLRQMLRLALQAGGHQVLEAADEAQAVELLQKHRPALVLTDLKLPRGDGFGVLRAARQCDAEMPVVLLTAYGGVPDAVRAMREGALDFLAKPVDPDHLRMIVARAIEQRRLATENQLLREELARHRGVPRIVGEHETIREALAALTKAATSDATVLLRGESGTGKELFARALHALSPRRDGPFVAINCAAIPATLARERAVRPREGRVHRRRRRASRAGSRSRIAARSSSTRLASCRWRFSRRCCVRLQERAFERLGGNTTIQIDVRVVAATNRDLRAAVAARQFREDLFFRLDVFRVAIPPLRDRLSDVPLIAAFVLQRTAAELNKPVVPQLSIASLAALSDYTWPGNVRELENCLERAVILSDGATIEPRHLGLPARALAAGPMAAPVADPWDSSI